MGWREWSQSLWDNWGSKLQSQYDKIDDMELPDEINDILKKLSLQLPTALVKGFLSFLEKLCKKEGKAAVIRLLEKIKKIFS